MLIISIIIKIKRFLLPMTITQIYRIRIIRSIIRVVNIFELLYIKRTMTECDLRNDAKDLKTLLENYSNFFVAMGDEIRRGLFLAMIESGEKGMNVQELTSTTSLSRPAISHHIKVLKDCGMIKARKEGTKNFYYVDIEDEVGKIHMFMNKVDELAAKQ